MYRIHTWAAALNPCSIRQSTPGAAVVVDSGVEAASRIAFVLTASDGAPIITLIIWCVGRAIREGSAANISPPQFSDRCRIFPLPCLCASGWSHDTTVVEL